jgi:type IV secretion system protein VirB1
MLPGLEMMGCTDLAVPREVMQHVVRVESSFNPYAIGVVGGRLARQPRNLSEAVSTARMLESRGYNFSLGLAQVNRYNLARYGLDSYERAFQVCPNLQAGSRILAECHGRAGGDWGKAFSCYYSGNFTTGFRHGYVQKVFASWQAVDGAGIGAPVSLYGGAHGSSRSQRLVSSLESLVLRRIEDAARREVERPASVAHEGREPDPANTPGHEPADAEAIRTAIVPASRPQPVLLQPQGLPPVVPTALAHPPDGAAPQALVATRAPVPPPSSARDTALFQERREAAPERDSAFVF